MRIEDLKRFSLQRGIFYSLNENAFIVTKKIGPNKVFLQISLEKNP